MEVPLIKFGREAIGAQAFENINRKMASLISAIVTATGQVVCIGWLGVAV